MDWLGIMKIGTINLHWTWTGIAGALVAGCLMLFFPLVSSFHLDSALLAGTAGAFAGAWMAARPGARDRDLLPLAAITYTTAIPLIARDAISGCLSADGAAFWATIPVFSILFGFSAGRALRLLGFRKARMMSIAFVLLAGAGGLLLPLLLFPQLYFFNHVFGYWPGAIYDQAVVYPGKMGLFRLMTLTWIAVFWILPHLAGSDRILKSIFALLMVSLAINYALATRNGLVSPESRIQKELGGAHQTEHFTLYYSKRNYSTNEIEFLARLHEFHFRELADTLNVSWPAGKRISSYLYGDEWQMQRLTGAKGVSYVPVWQRNPQIHMRKAAIDGTLRHELVHVVAREFGNRLINASWSIGMVEGLAVALAPASSARLTYDQLVVSNEAFYSGEELERLFSFTGFYRESGPVAYAVSGSFTAVLLREYPVERFMKAYRSSSLEKGYGELLPDAITKWHRHVEGVAVTDDEKRLAESVFAVPSLFDVRCPRKLTRAEKNRDAYRHALANGDTARATGYLENLLDADPDWDAGWMQWMRLQIETGNPDRVIAMFSANGTARESATTQDSGATLEHSAPSSGMTPDHPLISVRLADACIAAGQIEKALKIRSRVRNDTGMPYDTGENTFSGEAMPHPKPAARGLSTQDESAWKLRTDISRWEKLVKILYLPDPSLDSPPDFVMESGDATLVRVFLSEWFRRNTLPSTDTIPHDLVEMALQDPVDPAFFEVYRNLIYLSSPHVPAAFFEDKLSDREWRPSRQARLEEALRFAGS